MGKTTRCFEENDTLFWGKRHVVLRNYGWIEEGLSNNPFMDLFFRGLCNHCDTCDSKKAKTPVGCARTRAREQLEALEELEALERLDVLERLDTLEGARNSRRTRD